MKIESSSIQMASRHQLVKKREVSESIRMWVGDQRPDFEGRGSSGRRRRAKGDIVNLSKAARTSQNKCKCKVDDDIDSAPTPELRVLKMMVERMLGIKINLSSLKVKDDPEQLKAAAVKKPAEAKEEERQGFGVEYDYHESYYEAEKTEFASKGVIKTSDGETISFNLDLKLTRKFISENNVRVRAGDANLHDPLIINFGGNSAQLSNTKFSFDLDADGKEDQISSLNSNSGFLVLDRNGDNKVNDGTELFGPRTGHGFNELAKYDSDGNGWIDENDPIYEKLSIWSGGNSGLTSLKQKDVGAIYLGYQSTQFDLNNRQNEILGRIRSTGIYVNENGSVGTIQQVDLAM